MKKSFLYLLLLSIATTINAQNKVGAKIGYIDMYYILENIPDYKEAANQLEQKAQGWKQDLEVRKTEIGKLEELLKNEKTLLTKELIEEKEAEIKFLKNELLDLQQKRFGPRGDLIIQKETLTKPIQDQVFNAVQDLAEARGYDFILDKSSDMTILFSAKKFDISDQIVRTITRAEKREELTKKQQKALEQKEQKEDQADNPVAEQKQKILDEKKAAREAILEERKLAAQQRKDEFEARRKKMLEERSNKKIGTTIDSNTTSIQSPNNTSSTESTSSIESKKTVQDSITASKQKAKLEIIEKNKQALEERRKMLEEKRNKILADKEAARKALQEKTKN